MKNFKELIGKFEKYSNDLEYVVDKTMDLDKNFNALPIIEAGSKTIWRVKKTRKGYTIRRFSPFAIWSNYLTKREVYYADTKLGELL